MSAFDLPGLARISEADIERFHRDGFVLGPTVLDKGTVKNLLEELERVDRDDLGRTTAAELHGLFPLP